MNKKLLGTVAVAGAACVAYGVLLEAHAYQVRRVTIPVLPRGARRLRILHVSDIHLLPRQTRKRDFLRGLAGLEPDLVVSTGDHISSADAIGPLIDSLGRLRDFPGVFVFGSNDFEAPRLKLPLRYLWGASTRSAASDARRAVSLPADQLRAALEEIGWVDLDQHRADLDVAGRRIAFRGTGDAHHGRDDYAAVAGPATPGELTIGVTHAPYQRVLDAMTADGVQVIFAGHTHGGQVCIPGRGALVTNCDLAPEHAKGLFTHEAGGKRSWVNVSAGIGMSPFAPYRFACPPEVSLVTLTEEAADA